MSSPPRDPPKGGPRGYPRGPLRGSKWGSLELVSEHLSILGHTPNGCFLTYDSMSSCFRSAHLGGPGRVWGPLKGPLLDPLSGALLEGTYHPLAPCVRGDTPTPRVRGYPQYGGVPVTQRNMLRYGVTLCCKCAHTRTRCYTTGPKGGTKRDPFGGARRGATVHVHVQLGGN